MAAGRPLPVPARLPVLVLVLAQALASPGAHASEVPEGPYYLEGMPAADGSRRSVPVPAVSQLYPPVNGISLRRAVEITGPFITLGDLFHGLPGKNEAVVARAPYPGEQSVLNARWLEQAVRAHGIEWRPNSSLAQVVVTRPGETVPLSVIEEALKAPLVALGAPERMTIELTSSRTPLSVAPGAEFRIRVSGETYDPQTRRFSAVLEVPAGAPDARRVQVSGRFSDTRDIPVLARRLGRGHVIRIEDIDFVSMKVETLPSGVITDVSDLLGKEPRNVVREGEPVRRSELLRPEVVRRNAVVTMELSMPGLNVTAKGRALESGADGDVIRVMNLASRQVVNATVVDPSRVIVAPPSSAAAAPARSPDADRASDPAVDPSRVDSGP
ncbi:flagellar basal body P-ring formation chaperone FlgA [Phaeovibrio sulfidiphilus]